MSKRKTNSTNKMPWFKFYTADYITATVNMSAAERGIYVDLLRLFWEYGSLPDDLDKIRVRMLPSGERHHSRINKWIRKVLEQCFRQTEDGGWCNPGFGDVARSDQLVPRSDKVVPRSDKVVEGEGVLLSEINAPGSQEQNREEQEHTQKEAVCGKGKDKKEEPTDSGDDAEIMELFKGLADKDLPSRYRSPTNGGSSSPDGTPANGHGPNGHGSASADKGDIDRAVATYLATYPMTTGEPDAVRREMAKALTRAPFDEIMTGLSYHKSYIWTGGDRYIARPQNFLSRSMWKERRRSREEIFRDQTPMKRNDGGGCDDGSDRAFG